MTKRARKPGFFSVPKWHWAPVLVLVLFATGITAIVLNESSIQRGAVAVASPEVHFTDASPDGLSIVPASCPSDPYDADSPYGCSGSDPLCPDGSLAPNSDVTQCTCAQGNTSACSSNPNNNPPGGPNNNPPGGPNGGSPGGGGPNGCPTGQLSENNQCVNQCDIGYTQEGGYCVSNACPIGYALEGNTCVFVSCPSGYTKEGNSCVLDQCSIGYSCIGNDLYYEDSSCVASLVQDCSYGCSVDACLPAPTPSASITAAPQIVKVGETSKITWSAQNVVLGSCKVTGTNGDSWTGESGTQTSSAIEGQVVYTLNCTGLDDSSVTEQVTVNVVPTFQET
jgi:hypothetical protein